MTNPHKERFDQFMERALHHPEHGYYARKINTVGKTGDFSTTATLSPILGRALAATFLSYLAAQKSNHFPAHVIEIGAGDGSLAASFLKSLPLLQRLKTRYHIVDSSAPLTAEQQKKLKRNRVHWHTEIESALSACHGRAFIFSNELVDAFPVRILQKSNNPDYRDTQWDELYLQNGKEILHPCPTSELPDTSATDIENFPVNQRIEIHQSYHQWLQQWLPHWKQGQLITIDYGDTFLKLYYRMPHGTIRAYHRHQHLSGTDIYLRPGHQDLTADVNFTDLQHWGKQLGLENLSLTSQTEFLTPHATPAKADQYLIDPYGPGSAFKVLIQQQIHQPEKL